VMQLFELNLRVRRALACVLCIGCRFAPTQHSFRRYLCVCHHHRLL
jgi:hypothetical protein